MDYEENDIDEKLTPHRKAVFFALCLGFILSFAAPSEYRIKLLSIGAGAGITLWWPWFWVWDVPRKFHFQPAPIEYIYVLGWAVVLYWHGNALYRIFTGY